MADVEQDLEKIAGKENLEELENEVKELRNRSRRNNLVYFIYTEIFASNFAV